MTKSVPNFTDRRHLQTRSYRTNENLNIRIQTHQLYTKPEVDLPVWALEKITWLGNETVVDIGCGSGSYIEPVRQRGHRYIAGDLSFGMLRGLAQPGLERVNLDAQTLPLANNVADVVLANHMLYHVPDKDAAISEIRRVLHPRGKLIAATNSDSTMKKLRALPILALRRLESPVPINYGRASGSFSLENGQALLEKWFNHVARYDLHSSLVFPEPQPVLDYINSGRDWYESQITVPWEKLMQSIEAILVEQFEQHDEFRVGKLSGVFVCSL